MIRYWIVFLSLAVSAFADETLYKTLKQTYLPTTEYLFLVEPVMNPVLIKDDYGSVGATLKTERKDYFPHFINVNDKLSHRYKEVIEDSVYLQFLMLSSIGILAMMPEDITNWNAAKLEKKSLSQRWIDNVSTKPVWDDDSWAVNYIGHPITGAYYYTLARNDGFTMGESALFSTLMSTFFWEYGYEAFAEVPSIQDLILTPLFGSLFGEGMYILEGKLDQQEGILFGSKTLGEISYFFLDPMGRMADWMQNTLHSFHIHADVTMTIQTYPYADTTAQFRLLGPVEDSIGYKEREYGFMIRFQ